MRRWADESYSRGGVPPFSPAVLRPLARVAQSLGAADQQLPSLAVRKTKQRFHHVTDSKFAL